MIGKQLHLRRIADLAAGRRLPSFCSVREFAEAGGLLSYGYGPLDDYRHAAALVKKILGGARPADLPFEQPTKLDLVINLMTANSLGLTMPRSLLLRGRRNPVVNDVRIDAEEDGIPTD